jgi:hypothetical protein
MGTVVELVPGVRTGVNVRDDDIVITFPDMEAT